MSSSSGNSFTAPTAAPTLLTRFSVGKDFHKSGALRLDLGFAASEDEANAAIAASQPPPFYPVAPEDGELDEISEVLPGKLYLTNWRGAEDRTKLKQLGVTHVAAVGAEFVDDEHEGLKTWKVDIQDEESAREEMASALRDAANFIAESQANAHSNGQTGSCLVHCAAGVSRSATCSIAYLILHEKLTLLDAFRTVVSARRSVWPNDGFFSALIELEKQVHGKASVTLEEYISWGDYEGPAVAVTEQEAKDAAAAPHRSSSDHAPDSSAASPRKPLPRMQVCHRTPDPTRLLHAAWRCLAACVCVWCVFCSAFQPLSTCNRVHSRGAVRLEI